MFSPSSNFDVSEKVTKSAWLKIVILLALSAPSFLLALYFKVMLFDCFFKCLFFFSGRIRYWK